MYPKMFSAWFVALSTATAVSAPPAATRVTADPNDPAKTRTMISFEEREALGIEPHTWTGVMHPEVYPTLDRLNATVAELRSRATAVNQRDVEAFDALWRVRFPGTVYVQVQLISKEAQHQVLGSLTAAEFYDAYLFNSAAGIVGYATKEGLDKLGANSDVTGVCLDNKPVPAMADPLATRQPAPKPTPGEAQVPRQVERIGSVEAAAYQAIQESTNGYVFVLVNLRRSIPEDATHEERGSADRDAQARILSALTADEFRTSSRGPIGGLTGHVNRAGLDKLSTHPDVLTVDLPALGLLGKLKERVN
jgi:hypothetical protein